MARIGMGSALTACAALAATSARAFEAKWVQAGGGASGLMGSWDLSPDVVLVFAVAIGVGAASVFSSLFARR